MADYILSAFADEASTDLEGQMEAMQENGISLLEMRGVDGKNVSELTDAELRRAASSLKRAGLSTWSIGSPIGKIKITDDFAPHVELFKRVLSAAEITGASCIRFFSFYGVDSPEKINEVMERIGRLIELAKGTSVTLCHENEKGIYGWNVENCLHILQTFPTLRAVFDPANFVQCGVETGSAWKSLAPYVHYLHIKDALVDGTVVPAGYGIGQLPEIMRDFKKRGGKVYSLEPHLRVFPGFNQLEGGERSKIGFAYPDGRSAMRASADAAKAILNF
jgi:sugar phosphate isomerase/epimerase